MRAAIDTDPRPPGGWWSDEQIGESELVAQGAERIVAILGVPALVMGIVVTPAPIPDERNQVPGHDSIPIPRALDQPEDGPHDATRAQGEQHDKDHNDLVHYRRPQSQLG
jgi:hypothetical protein